MRIYNGPFLPSYGAPNSPFEFAGSPIPPNKKDFHTAISEPGFTVEEFNRLQNIDRGITVGVIVLYEDSIGNQYETFFCLSGLATSAITYDQPSEHCHNEIR
jgi:hypothetical protein